jgi:hypothetical protein
VQQDLNGGLGMRSLFRIVTTEQLHQFTKLWSILQGVVLQDRPNAILWWWTASGVYTTASAYHCQFVGAVAPFRSVKLWKAHTEQKCKSFAWVVLHGKILTADDLAIREWPHDSICKLSRIHPETVQHLLLDCSFSTVVRERIFAWNGSIGAAPPPLGQTIDSWRDGTLAGIPKEKRREASGAFIYTMWGTWKERNRRVFRNVAIHLEVVAYLVWEEIEQWAHAHTQDPGDAV